MKQNLTLTSLTAKGQIKIVALFMLLFCTTALQAQFTAIPDVAFEQRLISLGLDSGPVDHQVLTSNIVNVTDLNAADSSISDLTGVRDFTSLKNLYCFNSNISSLDVSGLSSLEKIISYQDYSLTTVTLTGCTALNYVNFGGCPLTNISFAGLTSMGFVEMNSFNISEIDLSGCPNLTYIYFVASSLNKLNLSGLTNMSGLMLNVGQCENLSCVQVSDVATANQLSSGNPMEPWAPSQWSIPNGASYSTDCGFPPASPNTFQVDGINYVITSPTTVAVGLNQQASGVITIPSTVSNGSATFSVTSISNGAFDNNIAITSVTIGNSVLSIGETAFIGCNNLTSVDFGTSVVSIGNSAFAHCYALASVSFPDSVTNIGHASFAYCYALSSVTIGNGVTNLSQVAFQNCFALTSVTVNWSTPLAINPNVFSGVNIANATLTVPTGTASAYDTTAVWTDFGTITMPCTPVNNTTTLSACDSYTWSNNGQTYSVSGVYTGSTTNCVTEVLNLTIQNATTYYADADNDGFGNPAVSIQSCTGAPAGYVTLGTDCDDANPTVNPSAVDVCGDGIDNDCNGIVDNVGQLGGCNPTVNSFTIGASCGSVVGSLAVTIITPSVPGTATYTFRVTNVATNVSFVVNRPVNSFALSNYAGITLGTQYEVQVSLNGGATYGPPCIVFTPAPISTIGAQCGTTLTSMTQDVIAAFASAATGYRFRVTNPTTSAFVVYDGLSGQNKFKFSQLSPPFVSYGTTYSVEVALRNTDGNYLPYGPACNINTPAFPTSEIVLSQCDMTATSNTQTINAVVVSGATGYRFQLVNSSLGYSFSIDRTVANFNLAMFPGLLPGTTYTVRVAVRIGGVWGPLTGKVCNLTTPGSAPQATKTVTASENFVVVAYPNPFAESFRFDVQTTAQSAIQLRVYDMLGKQVENRNVEVADSNNLQIGGGYPSGVYNVIVSQGENRQTLRVVKR